MKKKKVRKKSSIIKTKTKWRKSIYTQNNRNGWHIQQQFVGRANIKTLMHPKSARSWWFISNESGKSKVFLSFLFICIFFELYQAAHFSQFSSAYTTEESFFVLHKTWLIFQVLIVWVLCFHSYIYTIIKYITLCMRSYAVYVSHSCSQSVYFSFFPLCCHTRIICTNATHWQSIVAAEVTRKVWHTKAAWHGMVCHFPTFLYNIYTS